MQWPAIEYEELPWTVDPDELGGISKTARRKIEPTYKAARPLYIAHREIGLSQGVSEQISEVMSNMARFDAEQSARSYKLPALLLRSESAASSQIENLTSSVRNVALAEISGKTPRNAKLIAGNVAAMRAALDADSPLDIEAILKVHRILISHSGQTFGGEIRNEQVWISGSAYSPHGASYVPPQASRVPSYLEDLVEFAARDDLNPIAKAAVFHAQFETVHPFIDGNGRTGRTLLHCLLRSDGVLGNAMLPVSAGLLHNIDGYLRSLSVYQEGDPEAVVIQLVDALDVACAAGNLVAKQIDGILEAWYSKIAQRKGSSIYRLVDLLVEQPVVDRAYLSSRLRITPRACSNLINLACEYGILRPVGGERASFYQCDDLIDALESISSAAELRRTLSRQ